MAQGVRHGDAVVPVAHEVQVPDLVDVDRRHGLSAALGEVDALPAAADTVRLGPESTVELAGPVDAADDRLDGDRANAQPTVPHAAQGRDDLLERQDHVDV